MKKKTILLSIAALGVVFFITLSLVVYGAFQGAKYLLSHATPQLQTLQTGSLPDLASAYWTQLQAGLKTTECQTAISQVTNIQVWLMGAEENMFLQMGLKCLGQAIQHKPESQQIEENENEVI